MIKLFWIRDIPGHAHLSAAQLNYKYHLTTHIILTFANIYVINYYIATYYYKPAALVAWLAVWELWVVTSEWLVSEWFAVVHSFKLMIFDDLARQSLLALDSRHYCTHYRHYSRHYYRHYYRHYSRHHSRHYSSQAMVCGLHWLWCGLQCCKVKITATFLTDIFWHFDRST